MLDLNVVTENKTCEEDKMVMVEKIREGSMGGEIDDSGTTNSYVVNTEASSNGGDEDSCSNHFAFDFGILKKKNIGFDAISINYNNDESRNLKSDSGFVTKQFFPLNGGIDLSVQSSVSASRPRWVDLSFSPGDALVQQKQQVKKSRRGPRSRSSQYRGVTFYRRTGRWESHIWDCGKQVYLGGFDTAHAAARVYDRAAIKFRGLGADINFNLSDYEEDMKQLRNLTKEEFIHNLRRHSTGFSRGSSKYRGVTLHKCGRWEARMGQLLGKKAYDKTAIECNGREAVTNFELSTYEGEIIPKIENGGIAHNLDLNLGISPPSSVCGPKGSDHGPFNLPNARKARMENPASATLGGQSPLGLAMVSEHRPIWTGVHPSFFPNYEGRAIEKTVQIGLSGLSNWAWQMHGQNGDATPIPLISTAASSGFSSSTMTASSSTLLRPHSPNTTMTHHRHFPPTAATNTTHYRS